MDPVFLEDTSASLDPGVTAGPLGWWGWGVGSGVDKERTKEEESPHSSSDISAELIQEAG